MTITELKTRIKNMRKINTAQKEIALSCISSHGKIVLTSVTKTGVVLGLKPHSTMKDKNGISMGIDHKGYFCHTHRARSKSYPSPGEIPVKVIKSIETTG